MSLQQTPQSKQALRVARNYFHLVDKHMLQDRKLSSTVPILSLFNCCLIINYNIESIN